MKKRLILLAIIAESTTLFAQDPPLRLIYHQPARQFTQAFPLGNGRLGATVFGGVTREKIILNDDSFWSGEPIDVTIPGGPEIVSRIEAAIAKRDHRLADQLAQQIQGPYNQSYQPLETLELSFDHKGTPSRYTRSLDLQNALAKISYEADGVTYTRTAFSSYPGQAFVLRLEADQPGKLNFEIKLSGPHQRTARVHRNNTLESGGKAPAHVDPNYLDTPHPIIYDSATAGKGMRYTTLVQVENTGGTVIRKGQTLLVKNADKATIYLTARTSFNGFDKSPSTEGADSEKLARADLQKLRGKTYGQIYQEHITDFGALSGRLSFRLNDGNDPAQDTTTEFSRLDVARKTELLFQLGRYFMISGSRPGSQPLNLQGIWNEWVRPPWSSNYTMNINSQMNYWPVMVTNLAECHSPMLNFIEELAVNGRKTAKVNYGKKGWVAHHNADVWRYSGTVGNKSGEPSWANFMGGGIWETFDFWEHYQFSQDRRFLEQRAYPLLKGAVEFSLDWLKRDKDGKLVPPFTVSSEATYQDTSGYKGYCISNTGQDIALYGELFMNFTRTCEILQRKDELYTRAKEALASLPPYQIDPEGKIKEWLEPGVDRPYGGNKNHLSQLIGFFPGRHLISQQDARLVRAVKRTLEIFGPGQSGWMYAWEINLWARLQRTEQAYELVKALTDRVGANDVNPDGGYQVDWLFGYTAGICEMLIQSHTNDDSGAPVIALLPALPKEWRNGSIRGIRARGGFEIDMDWKDGLLAKAVIRNAAPSGPKPATAVILANGKKEVRQITDQVEINYSTLSPKQNK
ncbi:glycoside hydrolase family 95 protein [Chitinophaga pollutisoli]|uniref:Glycoside hydrolase family 95 protein n=1 Tax=Chitinophaga pollutisoli TaxID=3133966 RepID=A0ABZ2YSM7_9BACT